MTGLRLLTCPAALRSRAAGIVAGRYDDPPTVDGPSLAALLPPPLRPGRGWPQGDDLVGLAFGGRLIVLDDAVIGGCGAVGVPTGGVQEIGYGLAPPYRGRGLGLASVRLLVDALRGEPGIRGLCADVLPANEPSWRLLVRLGFVRDPAGDPSGHHRYVLDHPDGPSRPPEWRRRAG